MIYQKKYYYYVVWAVAVLIILLIYFNVTELYSVVSPQEEEETNPVSSSSARRIARFDPSLVGGVQDNKTAFVFGATGIYSTSELFKCMSAIESLSKIGGWTGAIFLLMDKDTCLDRRLLRSFQNQNIQIVHVQKERRRRRLRTSSASVAHYSSFFSNQTNQWRNSEAESDSARQRKLFNTQPFERSMAVKMHILDYLPSHIEYAVWYDCDVLFVRPNCVQRMMERKPVITKQKPFFLSFAGHVGSFVVRSDISRDALAEWHDELLASNSPSALGDRPAIPDYKVFMNLFGGNLSDPDAKFGQLDKVWHDIMPKSFAANHSVYWNTTECVVHLSNGRCRHLGASNIDSFVSTLHLRSYVNHKWCPSVIRRKFKSYGMEWPFCWNPPFFWDG